MTEVARRCVLSGLAIFTLLLTAGCAAEASVAAVGVSPASSVVSTLATATQVMQTDSNTLGGGIAADIPIYATVSELVQASSLVAVGRVLEIGADQQVPDPPGTPDNKKGSGLTFRSVRFGIEEVLAHRRGPDTGADITLVQYGATSNGRTMTLDGEPTYVVGDRALLFLVWFEKPYGSYATTGLYQGFYGMSESGETLSSQGLACEGNVTAMLSGKSLDEARQLIASANG